MKRSRIRGKDGHTQTHSTSDGIGDFGFGFPVAEFQPAFNVSYNDKKCKSGSSVTLSGIARKCPIKLKTGNCVSLRRKNLGNHVPSNPLEQHDINHDSKRECLSDKKVDRIVRKRSRSQIEIESFLVPRKQGHTSVIDNDSTSGVGGIDNESKEEFSQYNNDTGDGKKSSRNGNTNTNPLNCLSLDNEGLTSTTETSVNHLFGVSNNTSVSTQDGIHHDVEHDSIDDTNGNDELISSPRRLQEKMERSNRESKQKCNTQTFGMAALFNGPSRALMVDEADLTHSVTLPRFIPSVPSIESSSLRRESVLSDLLSRTSFPMRMNRYNRSGSQGTIGSTSFLHRYGHSNSHWGPCEFVQLELQPPYERLPQGEITFLEFDSEGVLLATADSKGMVRIFDFDELNCADMMARRDCCRTMGSKEVQKNGELLESCEYPISSSEEPQTVKPSKQKIYPMIGFQANRKGTNPRISCIKWNPFNEDQLAVAFLYQPEIYLYDVTTLSSSILPLCLYSQQHDYLTRIDGNKSLLFLSNNKKNSIKILSGGTQGTLALWQVNSQQKQAKLVWTVMLWKSYSNNEGISQIVQLPLSGSNGVIMVAGEMGSIAILDVNDCTRNAFSTSLTPKIIRIWHLPSRRELRVHKFPNATDLGINMLFLWGVPNRDVANPIEKTRTRHMVIVFSIVTNCGWVLMIQVEAFFKQKWDFVLSQLDIVHETATVASFNSEGNKIQISKPCSSFPERPTPSGCLHDISLLCVADVKPTYQVIRDNVYKVLDNVDDIETFTGRMDEAAVLLLGQKSSRLGYPRIEKIPISGRNIYQLAVHPHDEWIILGLSNVDESCPCLELLHLHSKDSNVSHLN